VSEKNLDAFVIGYQHLIVDNILRLRIELQYFPFDSHVFSGLNVRRAFGRNNHDESIKRSQQAIVMDSHEQLLQDIQNYCEEDKSQNVEIRRDDVIFHSCRFLLCARSKVIKSNR
jgi:hypothetical protein